VSADGKQRPPHPRIEIAAAATEEEAAAITAALERFLTETAPAAVAEPPISRWQRVALTEGVERTPRIDAWGSTP